jgi:hypothetical protein
MKFKPELRFYRVYPSVVKAEEKTEIEIFSIHEKMHFKKESYNIRIVPKEKRDLPRNEEYRVEKNEFDEFSVKPENGRIKFEYTFHNEQEYMIVFPNENNKELYDEQFDFSFSVYSLKEDLYKLIPYKGDLHIHSTGSDGKGKPYEVASRYREKGFDFICLTDHHVYNSSKELKEMYGKTDCGLTVFCGEEVHNCDMGYFHIVNFGGNYSVNEIIEADYEDLKEKIFKSAENLDIPAGLDNKEYAFRKWICDEIRKSGGLAIFPHPYWTYRNEYHTETDMTLYSLKQGIYDIYEILGGCTVSGNNIQVSVYNELRAEGVDVPIVGSTDAHDIYHETSHFNHACTVVFAESEDKISDGIMDKMSVAVETIPGENPRVYGKMRLIKYALFLLDNYFPVYKEYTKDLGAFMRAYGKYGDCTDGISRINKEANEYKRSFFGRK